ncbi:T9SS C-terminal target domain-containing protein [Croceitalea rosinachiae]|uniref:T9SS C-terminal target domain-containing protein n=1 Tax=Croceitalea rosinachiae TaxID=3075596 RepID=A0ABU3AE03_9FLAO|nr:T9SS C-terminal target domain-containing protein [Croceitalea sp. F388]MDT0607333.1 T9SS C-terminal target domain-containing protein [Croceitalea sp. F388]
MKTQIWILLLICANMGWSQTDITEVGALPQQVFETSGLLSYNGKLITHNDSGNAPELYEIDVNTLEITRTVTITNVDNIDWEDIAQDNNYIYIGDFGNNNGDRQDLSILKIAKSDYNNNDTVTAETIDFIYEDQTNFITTENSDFDAEALFVFGDELIILTKQWQQQGTTAYKVPNLSGAFLAERMDSYQVDGLVTGAYFNENTNLLSLVGYSQFLFPFYALIENVDSNTIFSGNKIKSNLSIGQAQVEAITLIDSNQFYISSEEFSNPPLVNSSSRLFTFTLDNEVEENPSEDNPIEESPIDEELLAYKTFGSQNLNYRLNTERPITGMGIFDISGRMVSYVPLEELSTAPIDISIYNQSIYYLTFFLIDDAISVPFFRD